MEILENVKLSPMTTFKIGGSARYLVNVSRLEDVKRAIEFAKKKDIPWFVMSGGSNILISDSGFDGIVLYMCSNSYGVGGTRFSAGAGCNLTKLIKDSSKFGIGGWEKLYGIPGSLGGAVRVNARAFNTEIGDFILKVKVYDANSDKVLFFENNECEFGYRNSIFKKNKNLIILEVEMAFPPIKRSESRKIMKEIIKKREKEHMQGIASVGYLFVNPTVPYRVQKKFETSKKTKCKNGHVPADWLIEKAGGGGMVVGGVASSKKHPNYFINNGDATGTDVDKLIKKIRTMVKKKFAVNLEEEITMLGF